MNAVPKYDPLSFGETALKLRTYRQEVLGNNLTNSDTPNFKARDIDFASVLNNQLNGISDNTNNTYDIVVTNDAAKAVTGYLVLRKIAGWDTKVEYATYGAYDDSTRVGASTTLSGSPDKV